MKIWVLLSLVCLTSVAFAGQEAELGCKHLRVVLDARLSAESVEHEWGSGHPRHEAPATLDLFGCEGQLLDRIVLESSLAKLDSVPLRGTRYPTYLVSADLTAEAGSYNGPLTVPIQIVNDRLVAAVAQLPDKRREPIRLSLTGKSAWRRVSIANSDNLLFVSCQPTGHGFVTSYRRYFPSGRGWKVKVRTQDGLWESDGEFPSRNLFP